MVAAIDDYGNRKPVDDKLSLAIYNHLKLNPEKEFTVKEIYEDLGEEFLIDAIRVESETLRRIGEIGGKYKQVTLEDGRRFGYWKYSTVRGLKVADGFYQTKDVIVEVQSQPVVEEDEFEEEF
jgi:hypothetical protein